METKKITLDDGRALDINFAEETYRGEKEHLLENAKLIIANEKARGLLKKDDENSTLSELVKSIERGGGFDVLRSALFDSLKLRFGQYEKEKPNKIILNDEREVTIEFAQNSIKNSEHLFEADGNQQKTQLSGNITDAYKLLKSKDTTEEDKKKSLTYISQALDSTEKLNEFAGKQLELARDVVSNKPIAKEETWKGSANKNFKADLSDPKKGFVPPLNQRMKESFEGNKNINIQQEKLDNLAKSGTLLEENKIKEIEEKHTKELNIKSSQLGLINEKEWLEHPGKLLKGIGKATFVPKKPEEKKALQKLFKDLQKNINHPSLHEAISNPFKEELTALQIANEKAIEGGDKSLKGQLAIAEYNTKKDGLEKLSKEADDKNKAHNNKVLDEINNVYHDKYGELEKIYGEKNSDIPFHFLRLALMVNPFIGPAIISSMAIAPVFEFAMQIMNVFESVGVPNFFGMIKDSIIGDALGNGENFIFGEIPALGAAALAGMVEFDKRSGWWQRENKAIEDGKKNSYDIFQNIPRDRQKELKTDIDKYVNNLTDNSPEIELENKKELSKEIDSLAKKLADKLELDSEAKEAVKGFGESSEEIKKYLEKKLFDEDAKVQNLLLANRCGLLNSKSPEEEASIETTYNKIQKPEYIISQLLVAESLDPPINNKLLAAKNTLFSDAKNNIRDSLQKDVPSTVLKLDLKNTQIKDPAINGAAVSAEILSVDKDAAAQVGVKVESIPSNALPEALLEADVSGGFEPPKTPPPRSGKVTSSSFNI